PAARPRPYIWVETSNLKPTDEATFLLRIQNNWNAQLPLIQPFIAHHLPPGLEYVGWEQVSSGPAPTVTVLDDYGEPGRTLVRFDLAQTLARGQSFDIRIRVKVAAGETLGWHPTEVLAGTNRTEHFVECATSTKRDTYDVDFDGNVLERLCLGTTSYYVNQAAQTEARMLVKGAAGLPPLDWTTLQEPNQPCPDIGGFTYYPCVAQTTSLGQTDYQLEVQNTGNVDLTDFTLVNTLPFVGDTFVTQGLSSFPRESDWRPTLRAPLQVVEAPSGAQIDIEYSTQTNPCRPELAGQPAGSAWPIGCVDDWGPAPADLGLVQAVRLHGEFPAGTRWGAGEKIVVAYNLTASHGSPFGGEIGWTSFGYIATRADTGFELAPAEPRKTGMVIKPPDNGVGDFVWLDEDRDGLQDADEPGLNGVRVQLFRADGTFEDETTTSYLQGDTSKPGYFFFGDRFPGSYYLRFEDPRVGWNVTTPDAGADNADSDGNILSLETPVFQLGQNQFLLDWDQGYFVPGGPISCTDSTIPFDPTDTDPSRRQVNDPIPCPS
ncbi:MAG TPA: hypothetical protein ENI86_04265, partial [Acidimicrobiales bacterium]|nr:hypothetical protein [Acidimicrobiales bacterium]